MVGIASTGLQGTATVKSASTVLEHQEWLVQGALEELLACCDHSQEADGGFRALDDAGRATILARGRDLNEEVSPLFTPFKAAHTTSLTLMAALTLM